MSRFVSEQRAAKALGIPLPIFRSLIECRRLPGPQPDIGLFDIKALDLACDRLSGLGSPENALDAWKDKKMVRVRLKGINQVHKRLADGSIVTYWYAWKGGPRLLGSPGSPDFVKSYEAAHRAKKEPDAALLQSVITSYKQSRDFTALAPRTRKDYLKQVALIEEAFSDLPLEALKDPRVWREFVSWRDDLKCSPRQADYALVVLRIILSWARDYGLTCFSPPPRIRPLYRGDRSEKIWLPEHLKAFRAVAAPELFWALTLASETGQRQGDLLRLPWTAIADGWITFRQGKTKSRVSIPITAELSSVLAEVPRRGVTILTSSLGRPWTSDGFRTSWHRTSRAAGVVGLTFHDLRGTAVTRLAEAGCTEAEIAAITGHSIKTVSAIIDRYLARTKRLALSAIAKLEKSKT